MDTILLFIGVVGLSVSGWVLIGYFLNVPPTPQPESEDSQHSESEQEEANQYVTKKAHQSVLNRLAELERGPQTPKVSENGTLPKSTGTEPSPTVVSTEDHSNSLTESAETEESANSQKWHEIFVLQEALKAEQPKDKDVDFECEQVLFDLSQGYDNQPSNSHSELELNERFIENALEEGEPLTEYQQHMEKLASLTKEMLITRLEVTDRQLREQQERHQAALLSIITSLIGRIPGDINVKNVVESSFLADSEVIASQSTETNRNLFQEMFFKSFSQ
jgi:hypothetical protein